jgi:hypothetical protein
LNIIWIFIDALFISPIALALQSLGLWKSYHIGYAVYGESWFKTLLICWGFLLICMVGLTIIILTIGGVSQYLVKRLVKDRNDKKVK